MGEINHRYAQGDKVWCRTGDRSYDFPEQDEVVRVTAKSVITERHGSFLLRRIAPDGTCSRGGDAWSAPTYLWPADHPGALREVAALAAVTREMARSAAIRETVPAVNRWVKLGTPEALEAMITHLRAGQAAHGEPVSSCSC